MSRDMIKLPLLVGLIPVPFFKGRFCCILKQICKGHCRILFYQILQLTDNVSFECWIAFDVVAYELGDCSVLHVYILSCFILHCNSKNKYNYPLTKVKGCGRG